MKQAQNVFIGFGKAAKTLAVKMAAKGETVILIEKDDHNYGGTCINQACIPSKNLYLASQQRIVGSKSFNYRQAISRKNELTSDLREMNLHNLADKERIDVINGQAVFQNDEQILVTMKNGETEEITGDRIFINTGSQPNMPAIPGIDSPFVVNSTELMEQKELPEKLVIIGGGYIGLEFASIYRNFGSEVTVIDQRKTLLPQADPDIAVEIAKSFDQDKIKRIHSAAIEKIEDKATHAVVTLTAEGTTQNIEADLILVAAGRKPNVYGLGLENTSVQYNERGIIVDRVLKTTAEKIWAVGDVKGGPQFTYISQDDARIIENQLYGDGSHTLDQQVDFATTAFLNPPYSRVGLSEAELQKTGRPYGKSQMKIAALPKGRIYDDPRGMVKILVNEDHKVVGAELFCRESPEMINLLSVSIKLGADYEILRDHIYTHPTMTEILNPVLNKMEWIENQ
ncbi:MULTISPECIES: FAD-dependent oxidoreductase [unclassified Enterococcus]|jgi:pyruvate/2-oxoglutarate dehydrogenase complex dihydrolipoamide dehydrogenase (E3) component|uniref:FAD-dependent oxidoreductase n=1 Tax=unclassified Enterococcus TaxID=2608891 RepID=UPI003D2A0DF3